MMEKPLFRTDLASESGDGRLGAEELSGVRRKESAEDGVALYEVVIESREAARFLDKGMGRYLTLSVGRVWEEEPRRFRELVLLFSRKLKSFLPPGEGCILLVGLGNRHITADAIGPMSMEHVLVTRHLKERQPHLFSSLSLSPVAAISPGVLGETGVESADIIRSLVRTVSPRAVIAVDALASRSLARLATTVQISDAGLSPGSGVGNRREAIDENALGVPVIAVGVPTVVDVFTLAWDVLQSVSGECQAPEEVREALSVSGLNFFVTPKETDEILKRVSELIGYGINLALHPEMEFEEMLSLVG